MNREALRRVMEAAPHRCAPDHRLAPYTAYKVGGPADLYAEPDSVDELAALLAAARREEVPVFSLGGGTNLLVRDGGIRGLVIRLGKGFRTAEVDGERLVVGAAATLMRAAAAAEKAGLAGLEFGYDIPGTLGGALRMNAGCHGSEIRDVLAEVRGVDYEGNRVLLDPAEIRFSYRTAVFPRELILTGAVFALRRGDPAEVEALRKRYHEHRLRTQPKGRSVGSVFKNPSGDYAGRLIEAAGLKGTRIGGAVVSAKHANFILNDSEATAADLEALIRLVRDRVRERHGVELELEARIVGDPLPEEARR